MESLKDISEASNTATGMLDIFSNIKYDTLRRNSKRSIQWMINKLKNASNVPGLSRNTPKIGGMYIYVYDAKFKNKLPFWDSNPLVIPVQFSGNGFMGLNFHYLPLEHRKILLNTLTGMSSNNSKKYIVMSYGKLKALSSTIWKFAFKRYLYSHLRTKLIAVERDEWYDAITLPIANFQKATNSKVFSTFKKSF